MLIPELLNVLIYSGSSCLTRRARHGNRFENRESPVISFPRIMHSSPQILHPVPASPSVTISCVTPHGAAIYYQCKIIQKRHLFANFSDTGAKKLIMLS